MALCTHGSPAQVVHATQGLKAVWSSSTSQQQETGVDEKRFAQGGGRSSPLREGRGGGTGKGARVTGQSKEQHNVSRGMCLLACLRISC